MIAKRRGLIQMTKAEENQALSRPNHRIWAIAGPAMLANSSAPLVGLVDTWAVGHLPSDVHLAVVGLAGAVFTYIFWMFGFLRMGTTGLVAQAHGAGDHHRVLSELVRAMIVGGLIATLILLVHAWIRDIAFTLMETPAAVLPYAENYFDIRIWSAPATLFSYSINGFLIGTARAKSALLLQLVLNITNGVLNLVFVIGLGMGVAGVALGTVIAEWLTALLGLILVARFFGLKSYISAFFDKRVWHAEKFKRLFSLNSFIFMRTLLLLTALLLVTRTAAGFGQAALAASHIVTQFLLLISLGLDGFAYAAEALAGAAYGARNRKHFRQWVKLSFMWAIGTAVAYSILFALGGNIISATLTNLRSVQVIIDSLLPIIILMPLIAVWSFQFDGIYIGATAASAMFGTMAVAFTIYIPTLDFLSARYGLLGVWYAVLIFMAVRGVTQAFWYSRIENKLS